MIDFDAIVAAAMKDGTSREDLAMQFSAALNKSKDAEVKKRPATREDMINVISDIFDEHMKAERLDLADAAALVWLCAIDDTDIGKAMTSPKEMMDFLEFITDDLSHTTEKWQAQKALNQIFKFSEPEHKCDCHNKRQDTEAAARPVRSDGAAIADFLKGLGLLS